MSRPIERIVIHCSGSQNGLWIDVDCIDHWHAQRGFKRDPSRMGEHEPQLRHIGYHWVIYTSGSIRPGRHPDEPGAPRVGSDDHSLGICLAGRDAFTPEQWDSLALLVRQLQLDHPRAAVAGHRDVASGRCCDGDGIAMRCQKAALCPGFSVIDWLAGGCRPLPDHLYRHLSGVCCEGGPDAERPA